MFLPDKWPAYYSKCNGNKVWGLDNKEYIDFSLMGVGTCALGYGDPSVNQAVVDRVATGVSSTSTLLMKLNLQNV